MFQFPVIYDTMTVAENLAFPLRNRGVPADRIKQRVGQIAEMLELSGQLDQRAAGLAADAKQKISLGRGLVREDVSAVLFDEPLTVIDPHLKWQLRRKLKQIHHELKLTLIYVTHDQVEALTFAEQVVVMTRGRAVQIGTRVGAVRAPAPHLRRLLHRLAGHELPAGARRAARGIEIGGPRIALRAPTAALPARRELDARRAAGVRRRSRAPARPARCRPWSTQAQDIGTYWLVTARVGIGDANRCCARGCSPTQAFRTSATRSGCRSSARTPASTPNERAGRRGAAWTSRSTRRPGC